MSQSFDDFGNRVKSRNTALTGAVRIKVTPDELERLMKLAWEDGHNAGESRAASGSRPVSVMERIFGMN